jgi:DNA-directed RNA polymerase omega subunit
MSYVPIEKVTSVIKNKYEAVVVAAREARHINTIMRMVGRDDAKLKVTTRALNRIMRGDVDYVYLDEHSGLPEGATETQAAQPESHDNGSEPAI